MTKRKAEELGIKPLMKLINICTYEWNLKSWAWAAAVIPVCLKQAGMAYDDVEY